MIAPTLPVCSRLLAAHADYFRRNEHLIVQHLKPDTAEIVVALIRLGCRIRQLVAIDYSCDAEALALVRQHCIAVEVVRFDAIGGRVAELIRAHDREKLVVWDVGGYAADVVADAVLARKVRFAIEDTNNGLWRYQSRDMLHCPVIEVASIENKQVENVYVGRRIVDGCLTFLAENSLTMPQAGVVVVGFGGIGHNVCAALRLKGINPAVVEIDSRKLALAYAMDFTVAKSVASLPDVRVIFGCTGQASVRLEDLQRRHGQIILVSGSSKKIEFSDVLEVGTFAARHELTNALLETSTNTVLANAGEPINLRYGSLNSEISDFMYANILAAVLEGGELADNTIFPLSSGWQRHIADLWVEQYLQR